MKSNIQIALDGNEANVTTRVGSNVYAYEIISALHRLTKSSKDISITVLLSSDPVASMPRQRKNWHYAVVRPRKMWTQWALPLHLFLRRNKYDIFFTPGHYGPRFSPVPTVTSVMDLAFLQYPSHFKKRDFIQLKNWTRYSVHQAKKVVAISEHTKKDVISTYKVKPRNVIVAPPAATIPELKITRKESKEISKKFGINNPYLVHIGTFQPRKNLLKLIAAFEQVCKKIELDSKESTSKNKQQYDLVLIGKIGWLAQPILDRIERSPYKNNIITTGFVTDHEKFTLLKYAQCSVHVGLYEGFGIPALESLEMNTIPIVSKSTSLPEVVGEAGIRVDPHKVDSIASGIHFVLTLKAKQKAAMRKAGREQRKKFSWEQSAHQILDVLVELAQRSHTAN